MKTRPGRNFLISTISIWLIWPASVAMAFEQPSRRATQAFDDCIAGVEARLERQHRSANGFLAGDGTRNQTGPKLRRGELIVEKLAAPEVAATGALLHDWRGTAFIPGGSSADFERLLKDFTRYPQNFSPQILGAGILSPHEGRIPDRFTAWMRVRQKHVITVVMDLTYEVNFGRLDARHGFSCSRSTEIAEIGSPGTAEEHPLDARQNHGFLWRINTYWSYEERDGGLYIEIESVSMTRGIPTGLGWAVRPYIESVPQETLEFTLRSASDALKKAQQKKTGI